MILSSTYYFQSLRSWSQQIYCFTKCLISKLLEMLSQIFEGFTEKLAWCREILSRSFEKLKMKSVINLLAQWHHSFTQKLSLLTFQSSSLSASIQIQTALLMFQEDSHLYIRTSLSPCELFALNWSFLFIKFPCYFMWINYLWQSTKNKVILWQRIGAFLFPFQCMSHQGMSLASLTE